MVADRVIISPQRWENLGVPPERRDGPTDVIHIQSNLDIIFSFKKLFG